MSTEDCPTFIDLLAYRSILSTYRRKKLDVAFRYSPSEAENLDTAAIYSIHCIATSTDSAELTAK